MARKLNFEVQSDRFKVQEICIKEIYTKIGHPLVIFMFPLNSLHKCKHLKENRHHNFVLGFV
jgi:hypothetical protein